MLVQLRVAVRAVLILSHYDICVAFPIPVLSQLLHKGGPLQRVLLNLFSRVDQDRAEGKPGSDYQNSVAKYRYVHCTVPLELLHLIHMI